MLRQLPLHTKILPDKHFLYFNPELDIVVRMSFILKWVTAVRRKLIERYFYTIENDTAKCFHK